MKGNWPITHSNGKRKFFSKPFFFSLPRAKTGGRGVFGLEGGERSEWNKYGLGSNKSDWKWPMRKTEKKEGKKFFSPPPCFGPTFFQVGLVGRRGGRNYLSVWISYCALPLPENISPQYSLLLPWEFLKYLGHSPGQPSFFREKDPSLSL